MSAMLEEFKKLPLTEKLQLVEAFWDEIAATDEPFPIPDWMRQVADERWAEIKSHPEIGLTREEMWKRVDSGNV